MYPFNSDDPEYLSEYGLGFTVALNAAYSIIVDTIFTHTVTTRLVICWTRSIKNCLSIKHTYQKETRQLK